MVMELWDYVNSVFRRLRGDASGRAVTLPEGQYLETPGTLDDEEYHHLTLTVDKKLRVDDPTTQAAISDLSDQIDETPYIAPVLSVQSHVHPDMAATANTIVVHLPNINGALPTTGEITPGIVNIHRFRTNARTTIVVNAAFSEATGRVYYRYTWPSASWANGDKFMVVASGMSVTMDGKTITMPDLFGFGIVTDYVAERGTDDAALAVTLEDAMEKATSPDYDQDTDSLEAIREAVDLLALEATLTAIKGSGWSDETLKAIVDLIEGLATERGTDGVDTAAMRGTDGVDTATMRGTDLALLAASYETERGTDDAETEADADTRYDALIAAIGAISGGVDWSALTPHIDSHNTSSQTGADVVDIEGAGYLLSVAQVLDATAYESTNSYAEVIIDGGSLGEHLLGHASFTGTYPGDPHGTSTSMIGGPLRFATSLQVVHRVDHSNSYVKTTVAYVTE